MINKPILKPTPYVEPKAKKSIESEIYKFADWILYYNSEPLERTVNNQVKNPKKQADKIFYRLEPKNKTY